MSLVVVVEFVPNEMAAAIEPLSVTAVAML
jgi:hypothetical protein